MTTPSNTPSAPAALLTVKEAAVRLFVSEQTLTKWRRVGHGPDYIEISARIFRYRPADIDDWLAGRARTPAGKTGAPDSALPKAPVAAPAATPAGGKLAGKLTSA